MRAHESELLPLFGELQEDPSYLVRPYFGGLAVYIRGRFVIWVSESPGDRVYKNIKCDFDIWDGVLIPTENEFQDSLKKLFPGAVSHPVLKKWLYIPKQTEDLEQTVEILLDLIKKADPRIGIIPQSKTRKKSSAGRKEPTKAPEKMKLRKTSVKAQKKKTKKKKSIKF